MLNLELNKQSIDVNGKTVEYITHEGVLYFECWADFKNMIHLIDGQNLKGLEIEPEKLRFTKAFPMDIDIIIKNIFENYNMQIAVCIEENLTKVVRGNYVSYVNIFDGKLEYC